MGNTNDFKFCRIARWGRGVKTCFDMCKATQRAVVIFVNLVSLREESVRRHLEKSLVTRVDPWGLDIARGWIGVEIRKHGHGSCLTGQGLWEPHPLPLSFAPHSFAKPPSSMADEGDDVPVWDPAQAAANRKQRGLPRRAGAGGANLSIDEEGLLEHVRRIADPEHRQTWCVFRYGDSGKLSVVADNKDSVNPAKVISLPNDYPFWEREAVAKIQALEQGGDQVDGGEDGAAPVLKQFEVGSRCRFAAAFGSFARSIR